MSRAVKFFSLIYLMLTSNSILANKSVFIISKHGNPSTCQAYSIDANQVTHQADVNVGGYNQGYGAVGIAVWPQKELIFVTYENSDMITWSSSASLEKAGEFDTDIADLAGITIDQANEKIYTIQRNTDNLYVYSCDDVNDTLILNNHYDLQVPSGYLNAWGIALDETNGLLYVSTDTKTVHVYDTNDWSHDHSIAIVVNGNDRSAVGIAVDPVRGYLYTGDWDSHYYLVRTQTTSPYTSSEVEIAADYSSAQLIGVDVDEESGYVYCTTYLNDFRVYDCNLVLQDTEENAGIYGPAGVAVGGWFKMVPSFSLVKDNNDPTNSPVMPFYQALGNYLIYDIAWDANGYADTNVVITDYLPKEVNGPNENEISGGGVYHPNDHTVTWDLNDISSSDSSTIQIKTKVNFYARPGHTITNKVEMEGDTYLVISTCDVNVDNYGSSIIYVNDDANGYKNGTNWQDAYTDLQDALTGAKSLGSEITDIWVAAGTYQPVADINVPEYKTYSFELLDNVGLFGHFDGTETSTDQRNLDDPNHITILEGQVGPDSEDGVNRILEAIDINNAVIDGFTIRKKDYENTKDAIFHGIYLNNADVSIANCSLINNCTGIEIMNASQSDIYNCNFFNNHYHGIFLDDDYSSAAVSYCIFEADRSCGYGLLCDDSALIHIDSSVFDGNQKAFWGVSLCCDASANIETSLFENHIDNGIKFDNSDLTLDRCILQRNDGHGLYGYFAADDLVLKNSIVRYNGKHGVYMENSSSSKITNCWIHDNIDSGIYLNSTCTDVTIRNNTLYKNSDYGIYASYSGTNPEIRNCIIYGNTAGDLYGTFSNVNYCDVNTYSGGTGNMTVDPCFMNSDPNDLHICGDSRCFDGGDPNGNYDETDIDGERRVCDSRVDIGADEYYDSLADYNHSDGNIVNFLDYAIFADAWQTTNPSLSLDADNDVDSYDLFIFARDWLWTPGWENAWMLDNDFPESQRMMGGGLDLMMTDMTGIMQSRPQRLIDRTQKFYDITPETTNQAIWAKLDAKIPDIDKILDWLDELWETGQLDEIMTEQEFIDFYQSVEAFK